MRRIELELDVGRWRYFVATTKRPHIATLSSQAVEILRELHPFIGRGEFVFPGGRDPRRHMSGNAILVAAQRCGNEKDESTIHGFRHMASTLHNEVGYWNPDAIESAPNDKMLGCARDLQPSAISGGAPQDDAGMGELLEHIEDPHCEQDSFF
ncbi:hypothetical protein N7367_09270 [Stenotrophomonas sp. GD04145]|uniref:tyrosine-type recombinase/integrase n=1 Tax=Stenotrophomonas sp. GD04145 TaxID=2975436 RepID=UPI0024480ACE|nr:hypothetical protein [Stenotrophomonas sp. GD04145]MDH0171633.1 hypothetical protein [Stenotrophomonas sp. GD04145]